MKLNYGQTLLGSQVLKKDQHRIELHIVRLDDELFALLMFSGNDNTQATKNKHQGPYHSKDQAQASANAITHEIKSLGYQVESVPLIWQLQAQAELKSMRAIRQENTVDTSFTPLGILPDED